MKAQFGLVKKAALVLLISFIVTGGFFVVQKTSRLNYKKILQQRVQTLLKNKMPSKVISVNKELPKEKPFTCVEKETLKNAKACALLIGDVEKHGSGFVIDGGEYLVTNYHVIDHFGDGYANVYYNGEFHKLRIAGFSVEDDLAIIKLDQKLPGCSFSDSQNLELAETVYAVGWPNSPYGESTITKGIFSRYTNLGDADIPMVQTDTSINPGNSGGPLINKCGVVGVNTSKVSWIDDSAPSEGIGYAISSNHAQKIVEILISQDDSLATIPQVKTVQDGSAQKNQSTDYLNPHSQVAYNYEQVLFWEDRKIRDEAVLNSWEKAKDSEFINENKLNDLINKMRRSLEIADTLWDGYTNSKITYAEVLSLKQEYFVLSKESSLLTNDLNIQGSINAYKNCVESWENLEEEHDEDFSEQIEECENILDSD